MYRQLEYIDYLDYELWCKQRQINIHHFIFVLLLISAIVVTISKYVGRKKNQDIQYAIRAYN